MISQYDRQFHGKKNQLIIKKTEKYSRTIVKLINDTLHKRYFIGFNFFDNKTRGKKILFYLFQFWFCVHKSIRNSKLTHIYIEIWQYNDIWDLLKTFIITVSFETVDNWKQLFWLNTNQCYQFFLSFWQISICWYTSPCN